MFGIKCAYCESPVDGASYQHVEHFRPQSIYPKLAYEWDNLLLVCEKYNSHHKKEKFPLRNGEQPTENLRDPCLLDASDDNLLVNPCQDDPINFFTFKDEYIVCKNQRAQVSRMTYGLDREALNDQRKNTYI
ncbi:MAG: TIGR02646 family protein [Chloroflexi bacterium]|nr:TIGR02646 family protein [Chloroflexota bacterium]